MDSRSYRDWWALHLRAACGESLTREEQASYQAGLSQLHQEEAIPGDTNALWDARELVLALEAEQSELLTRRCRLDDEIRALEALLSEPTRDLLGVGR